MVMEGWSLSDIGRAAAAGVPVTVIAAGSVLDFGIERDALAFAVKASEPHIVGDVLATAENDPQGRFR